MTQDIKTTRIVASLLHSRAMITGAPRYVIAAIQQWVEELDRAEGDNPAPIETKNVSVFSDGVSVTDKANLKLVPKEDKRN